MARTDVVPYQTDEATTGTSIICGVKITGTNRTLAGPSPGGSLPTNFFLADCTRNAKSAGLTPRHWKCTRISGTGPKTINVPILTAAHFNSKNDGDTVGGPGGNFTITKIAEKGYK